MSPLTAVLPLPAYTGAAAGPLAQTHSSGNFRPGGPDVLLDGSCSLSILSLLADPVTPSTLSTSAGVSNRFDNAAWAIGGFDDVVVVVVVLVVDAAGPLPLLPPHAAIDIATAATATPTINRRMRFSPFRSPWSTEHSLGTLRRRQIVGGSRTWPRREIR